MKLNKFKFHKSLFGLLLMVGFTVSFIGCKEDIDESNFAIKTEKTMSDHLADDPNLSMIKQVFDRVTLGKEGNASNLTAVLAARGNYTVFAPDNAAVTKYLESLGLTDVSQLDDETAQNIAYNCIIDNGTEAAYESPDFPTTGTFALSNLNDRLLQCEEDSVTLDFKVNGNSTVTRSDIEASNGMLHIVDAVIALSTNTVAELIQAAPNMQVMGNLLNETGIASLIKEDRDPEYELRDLPEQRGNLYASIGSKMVNVPQKRYLGFTGFVETDDVYAEKWGINIQRDADNNITNWQEVLDKIREKAEEAYGTEDRDNLASPNNAINRFVAYHFVLGKMSYKRLTYHFNEYLYQYGTARTPQDKDYTVEVWDYYTTVGQKPDLLKVSQLPKDEYNVGEDHPIYLNHICTKDNSFYGTYQETEPAFEGDGLNVLVSPTNGEYNNNSLNGFYFPINNILIKNDVVSRRLASERIRFDMTSMLHEFQSNNFKGGDYVTFENDYFDAISNASPSTIVTFLNSAWVGGSNWRDYQGDEFIVSGLFDFVLRLPPVPRDGTYELRFGASQNAWRGMAQVYIGETPTALMPCGLPLDMRQSVSLTSNPALNWQPDIDDAETNTENDKNLHNQGYMKSPKYFHLTDGQGDPESTARVAGDKDPSMAGVRRVLTSMYLKANKHYYLRFKSALNKTDAEFMMDYFEFCPSSIYNGVNPEDPW